MYVLIIIIILGLCGGGYYEYNDLQRAQQYALSSDQQQIDNLKSVNQKLKANADELAQEASASQAQVAALTEQLKIAQTNPAAAQTPAQATPAPVATPAPAPAATVTTQTPPATPAPASSAEGDSTNPFGTTQPTIITTNRPPSAQSPN